MVTFEIYDRERNTKTTLLYNDLATYGHIWQKGFWCGREDSNFHGLIAHSDLNAARLPIPPRPPDRGVGIANSYLPCKGIMAHSVQGCRKDETAQ